MSYIIHVRQVEEKQKYELAQIIAMDETPVWSYIMFATLINATGKKQSLKSPQVMKSPVFRSA